MAARNKNLVKTLPDLICLTMPLSLVACDLDRSPSTENHVQYVRLSK